MVVVRFGEAKTWQSRLSLVIGCLAFTLVPKLQLGNPDDEALGNCSMRCSTSCITHRDVGNAEK